MRPLLQPHLYELHNPLNAAAAGSTCSSSSPAAAASNNSSSTSDTTTTTKAHAHSKASASQQQQQQQHNSLNLDIDSHEALHEHIYHAYGDWDNSYDTTKMMLAGHKFSGALASELLSAAPPLMTANPFMQDPGSATLDMSALTSQVAAANIQFGAAAGASAACSSGLSSSGSSVASNSSASSSTCSIAAAFSGAATAASLLNPSVVNNHHSAKADHVHTDACFKNMKTLPASSTGSRMLFSSKSATQALKSGGLLAPSVGGAAASQSNSSGGSGSVPQPSFPVSASGSSSASATSLASLATGVSFPLSEHCLKHNPFLHTHHSSFSGTHTTTTISTASGLPAAHAQPMKLTSELIRSVTMKEGTTTPQSLLTSQPGSGPSKASTSSSSAGAPASNPLTCSHLHGAAGNVQGITQHNLHSALLDPNSQVQNTGFSAEAS